MIFFLNFVLFISLFALLIGFFSLKQKRHSNLEDINALKKRRKEESKKKIIQFLNERGRIKNNDVEKLAEVADTTATQYLQELEDEGLIVQKGKEGHAVFYVAKK